MAILPKENAHRLDVDKSLLRLTELVSGPTQNEPSSHAQGIGCYRERNSPDSYLSLSLTSDSCLDNLEMVIHGCEVAYMVEAMLSRASEALHVYCIVATILWAVRMPSISQNGEKQGAHKKLADAKQAVHPFFYGCFAAETQKLQ